MLNEPNGHKEVVEAENDFVNELNWTDESIVLKPKSNTIPDNFLSFRHQ